MSLVRVAVRRAGLAHVDGGEKRVVRRLDEVRAEVRVQGLGLGFRVRVGLGVEGVGLEGEP